MTNPVDLIRQAAALLTEAADQLDPQTKRDPVRLSDFMRQQIPRENISDRTKANYIVSAQRVGEYGDDVLGDMGYTWVDGFDEWLREHPYKQNTIAKHHRATIKYILMAVKHGIISDQDNPYKHFSVHTEKANKRALSDAEIKAIQDTTCDEIARDVFLFACHTGLRYGDLMRMSDDAVRGDWVVMKMEKTKGVIKIPIHKLPWSSDASDIIERYRPSFWSMSNSSLNRRLVVVANEAGIEPPTIHIGRHTFVSRLIRAKKSPMAASRLVGHADLKTTQTYIHMSDEDIEGLLD